MSNKQTAVEWLYQEITKKSVNDESHNVIGILNQAKELEKQQIIDAYRFPNTLVDMSSEEYYNETYGGQDNEQ